MSITERWDIIASFIANWMEWMKHPTPVAAVNAVNKTRI
jgi:hypothetical protein